MRKFILTMVVGMVSFCLPAQESGFKAELISNNINSDYDEINPIVSPDGKTIYFTRVNHPDNGFGPEGSQDIWYSTLQEDGTWSPAKRVMASFNMAQNNAVLAVTSEGKNLVVSGLYTKAHSRWKKRGLSIVTVNDSNYTSPSKLKVPGYQRKNKGAVSNAYVSESENIILLAYTSKWRKDRLNLYISKVKENGKYGSPKKIAKNLRKEFKTVEAPFLSADGNTLYFSGYRKGKENKGKYEIYSSTRQDDTYKNWGDAQLMNGDVNSANWDSYFTTDKEGKVAYFSSNRHGSRGADIYRLKLVEDKPYVEVEGFVINQLDSLPLDKQFPFEILVDGEVFDSLDVNVDSAKYNVKFPLGKEYTLRAKVQNFNSSEYTIDANKKEYEYKNQDLYVDPLKYVHVQGKLQDAATLKYLLGDSIKIAINDKIVDTVNIDGGLFDVNLPWGQKYSMQVVLDHYDPIPVEIDVTNDKSFRVIEQDLQATPLKTTVYLHGKILNKETNEVITEDVYVDVDDAHKMTGKIHNDGTYDLELPTGKKFTISASCDKYFPIYEIVDLTNSAPDTKIEKDLFLAPIKAGVHVRMNNIFFEKGKAELMPESHHDINKVIEFLNDNKDIKIEIGGHTDNVGSDATNLKLSEDRAHSVRDYIIAKGIAEERVTYKGYGESQPEASNDTDEGKKKNRRVEFTILE